ncbi:MAG: 30S ribosomal protein S5 [Nanoarchaeota archaeon]|nr:30S ribosomal protein S5 [Nanoarchaeota archaeon]
MAKKETKNEPKDLVEALPEEVSEFEKDPEVKEELKAIIPDEPPTREEAERESRLSSWVPKTQLGKRVREGKLKDIDKILIENKKILEPEIVEALLRLDSDLLLIGQAKGKFGGGKRRAWRQTQKKTMEGNVITFACMAVVGDKAGHIGIGYGRAKETLPSREKAIRNAKINIIKIIRGFESPEYEKDLSDPHTVPFKLEGKCGSVRITLMPAPRGTGLVIGDECKKILRLAGIKDVYAQTRGKTRTTFNLAKACIDALSKTSRMRT